MASETLQDRDIFAFKEISDRNWARQTTVVGANGEDLTTEIDGKNYLNLINLWPFLAVGNNILASYPSSTSETYQFRKSLTVVLSVLVEYTDTTKNYLSKIERTA